MSALVPTTVWRITPEVVLALHSRIGGPIDSYVNGSQVWLMDDKPRGITLEWRLHPAADYRLADGMSHYDLWEQVTTQIGAGMDPDDLVLGSETRALVSIWGGLECFAAYGDEIEPATLAGAAGNAVGIPPDAAGLVDHSRIGDAWENSDGRISIIDLIFEQLST